MLVVESESLALIDIRRKSIDWLNFASVARRLNQKVEDVKKRFTNALS